MPTCLICGDHPLERELLDHVRLHHFDLDATPERWPDGRWVWVDLTLDPDDFKE